MKKVILFIIMLTNLLFSAQVEELSWPKNETFLTFLEKYKVPLSLYYDLEKEDKELCSEIQAENTYFLYTDDNGELNQVLIPVSIDIQLHIYKDSKNIYKFETLPIDYAEHSQLVAIEINESISNDIFKATGDNSLSAIVQSLFKSNDVNFRKMQKGDFIAIQYTQKSYLGKPFGTPEINSAMVQINKKPYYRFKYEKDDKYYDEKGIGFTQTFLFQIPVTFARISSQFTNKRFHPVLKRYRAHLGTDFAAPTGRNIYAAGDGKIEFVGTQGGYGKTIIINHLNGYKTLYGHQSGFSKNIRQGQMIKKGEHIGYVGNTGLSSGPHLHFGMYKNGSAIDALNVIKKPQTDGLEAKERASFLANTQNLIKRFEKEISNEKRALPNKFERVKDRSDINVI